MSARKANRRQWLQLASASAAAFVVGCQNPRWTRVRQASGRPFKSETKFGVEPMHFEGMVVAGTTEEKFLATKNEDLRKLWETDRATMSQTFVDRLIAEQGLRITAAATPVEEGSYVIRTQVTKLEPGSFAGVVVQETEVHVTVLIVDAAGATADEFQLRTTVPAGATNPSTGGRLRAAANQLAVDTSKYIYARISG